ncbi:conserved hypothetical protein [Cupriavidus taiwanensis]|nr:MULTISPECIES: transposase [unclassified Cupriavidus]SOY75438.1 conserved hypothetical protein [Cupriavidus taiwanensis]SOY75439.1 conserved hypothetical protein [Cupriavidus taiwanensis]SOZ20373.1 conserved hypothetical protein [Cupriavidus taiwanensis]SOZ21505.1 conserved hypothetical protein [Cupriavidus taiwanensis]SOZ32678.1 conserved hypothetical protein [Cupriavidus taiwanensis]
MEYLLERACSACSLRLTKVVSVAPAPYVHESPKTRSNSHQNLVGQDEIEIKARGRRYGSTNCTKEFHTQVVAEARDPTRSLSEVARAHGLNANLVSKLWRDQEPAATSALAPADLILPVHMTSPPAAEPIDRACHRMSWRARVFRWQA